MLSLGLAIAVAGAVIVCIGFLIVLVLFSIRRYMSEGSLQADCKQNVEVGVPGADEKQEMEWDNSALNITVNPLDDYVDEQMAHRDEDADCDNCSNCESSDEEREMPRCKELEWDDSTLKF